MEADRLGLEVSLNPQSGWNLGGPDVQPAEAAKIFTFASSGLSAGRVSPGIYRGRNPTMGSIATSSCWLGPSGRAIRTRRPIMHLEDKTSSREAGYSCPKTDMLLEDAASVPGEEDIRLTDVVDLGSKMNGERLGWDACG